MTNITKLLNNLLNNKYIKLINQGRLMQDKGKLVEIKLLYINIINQMKVQRKIKIKKFKCTYTFPNFHQIIRRVILNLFVHGLAFAFKCTSLEEIC